MSVVLTILLCVTVGTVEGKQTDTAQAVTTGLVNGIVVTPAPPAPAPSPDPTPRPASTKVAPRQGVPSRPLTPPTARGGIVGIVRTQSGRVVPGVRVTVAPSNAKDQSSSGFTNASGQFIFANLPVGTYDVTATMPGFKTFKSQVQVTANVDAQPDVTLQLGSLSETVQIKGSPTDLSQLPEPVQINMNPRTVDEALDAAKALYQQRRFTDAAAMAGRAADLARALAVAQPVTPADPNPLVVRVGGNIREPKRIKYVDPIYPAEAMAARLEGYVTIEARIDTNGYVDDARIITGSPLLNDAALGAVRQWVYSPTILDGQAVSVLMTATVVFSLK